MQYYYFCPIPGSLPQPGRQEKSEESSITSLSLFRVSRTERRELCVQLLLAAAREMDTTMRTCDGVIFLFAH